MRSLYASSNVLLSKFSASTNKVNVQLLQSYSLGFYCPALWCNHAKFNMTKLRVVYNNVYRKVLGYRRRDSASTMFVVNNIDTFEAKMRKTCFKFKQRIEASENIIVQRICNNSWITNNYMVKYWNELLY